jgi:hypothetical protein
MSELRCLPAGDRRAVEGVAGGKLIFSNAFTGTETLLFAASVGEA